MNLPNQLTVLRLGLTAVFVICLTAVFPFAPTAALAIFIIAALTDYLDGSIARRFNLITDFGKLMDPVADKVLTASAFICLLDYHALPAWAVIIIISREFLITGLRLLAGSKGTVLPAEKLGKHKTAWQMITIIYFLLLLASSDWLPQSALEGWWRSAWVGGGTVLVSITVALTVYSGFGYLIKNRAVWAEME